MTRLARRAFTLVEMLLAVGIVTFLAGLTLVGATALVQRAEVERTRSTLALLDVALSEWQTESGQRLTWGPDPQRHDIWSERAEVLIITELLERIRRTDAARAVLAGLEPRAVYTYEADVQPPWIRGYAMIELDEFVGGITVLDAWGIPVYATHPGAVLPPGALADPDGTERTANENQYGVARDRRVCFVSAGPDRRFGLYQEFYHLPPSERPAAMAAARQDNLFSYVPGAID